ncbi:plastocyanin/azurin family copper-binding protein [Halobellus salinisoli]|uniref:plastocyanin/azurin family copper-binding protein n=1 Tax=Halobellus salinisoli TaxID=3108500 RepID=UPI00300AFC1E
MKHNTRCIQRRRFLKTTVVATAAVATAGCIGNSDAQEDSPDETDGSNDESHTHGDGEEHDEDDEHDESHSHNELPEEPSDSVTVEMYSDGSEHHFNPHLVWVNTGGTVTWRLESGTHTTTAYHADNDTPERIPNGVKSWDSGTLSEGGNTFEQTFEVEGVYDYYCSPHESMGMLGAVVVGNPDTDGEPGLAEPQEELPEAAREKISELNEMALELLD